MLNATADGITIINFGMGSASAATIMDLLTAAKPEAVLFLGKCGGVKHVAKLGSLVLPHRGHSRRWNVERLLPARSSALPAFSLQKPSQQRFATTSAITGQARFTPPSSGVGTR
jgi:AMP nucleosidase